MKHEEISPIIPIKDLLKYLRFDQSVCSNEDELRPIIEQLLKCNVDFYAVNERFDGIPSWQIEEGYLAGGGKIVIGNRMETLRLDSIHALADGVKIAPCGLETLPEGPVTDIDGNTYELESETVVLAIDQFELDGQQYYTGTASGPCQISIHLENICVSRINILNLLRLFSRANVDGSSGQSQNLNIIPAEFEDPNKKADINDQALRIAMLKSWLVTSAQYTSNSKSLSVADLEKCYELIQSPTREEVWASLNQIDKRLFMAGKDEFFKAVSKDLFKFKTGRRRSTS